VKTDDAAYKVNGDKKLNGIDTNVDTVCTRCGALYTNNEWTWNTLPDKYEHGVCPSCKRIEHNEPAGRVVLKGTYFSGHKDEIIQLIENISRSELSAHPLERLMDMRNGTKDTEFTTTGIHLARRIGNALQLAYEGKLITTLTDDDHLIVEWEKDL
jgi:hypothetical protein